MPKRAGASRLRILDCANMCRVPPIALVVWLHAPAKPRPGHPADIMPIQRVLDTPCYAAIAPRQVRATKDAGGTATEPAYARSDPPPPHTMNRRIDRSRPPPTKARLPDTAIVVVTGTDP